MVDVDEFQKSLPDGLTIIRLIYGSGGQRQVFEVDDAGTTIVIKLMPEEQRDRAEREVSIGSTFDHPNLARILDDNITEVELAGDEYVWFCEEFIPGASLADRSGTYDPGEALTLAADLIAAIHYLWENHAVVHRDIKPRNIIRRPDDRFVLIDVGYGRHQDKTGITTGELGPGSTGHLAPEQLELGRGEDLDARTDLFQIGIMVFEVLTGVLPFRPDRPEYRAKLLSGDWPRPQGLPPQLAVLLPRLLGRHPHQRPSISQAAKLVAEARSELECS